MEVEKVLTAVYDEDLENGVFRIPEDIRQIDDGAFSYCPNLRKLIVPNSIDWLPDFYDCLLLESIEVSEGNEEYSSFCFCWIVNAASNWFFLCYSFVLYKTWSEIL